MSERSRHWEGVYRTRRLDELSWRQQTAAPSLQLIAATGLGPEARFVDVGGGASPLAGELAAQGWRDLTVVDIAETALAAARAAMGAGAETIHWAVADILEWRPAAPFDLWHDRAVFHFLTEAGDQARYRQTLRNGLKPGGWLIMAAFAPDGPERCSGLPVHRWSVEALAEALREDFALQRHFREAHTTPGGAVQVFTWTLFRRLEAR